MSESIDYSKLVKQAQLGDGASSDELAAQARQRLYAYVYRIVLEEHLAQDIVQETMLEMFKILGKLENADRFWPWLRAIAFNQIRRHREQQKRHRKGSMPYSVEPEDKRADGEAGLTNLVGRELKQVVVAAVRQLKPRHRQVLTMRCYEEMQYDEIAELMGCSELGARVLFYRAKKSLQRALSRKGLGKAFLLTALALFGKMTAPSEAAAAKVSITAATCKVGAGAALLGIAASKTAIVSLTTAGVLAVGTVVTTSGPDDPLAGSRKRPGGTQSAGQVRAKGSVEETWYYFPEGPGGPVTMRMMRADSADSLFYCAWRQNEQANYHFDRHKNTAYVQNSRMWRQDLRVWRLPTDKPDLRQFLSKVEGLTEQMEYVQADRDGLLVITTTGGEQGNNGSRKIYHKHILDEEYFRYDWPTSIRTVDNRDEMHKRGWTYFRVKGRIGGRRVSGTGRIPLVYAASYQYRPWLRLKVAGQAELVDTAQEALIYDENSKVVASYAGGSFFKGLARPWAGLHTIDTIRRDAAERRVVFETKYDPTEGKVEIILTNGQGKIVYTIDMAADLIEQISFSTKDGVAGELRFSYLQDIEQAGQDFVEPSPGRKYGSLRRKSPGMLWLMRLMNGNWAAESPNKKQ
jgi:RNA polymerase sigma-70 factor (ECF subfamily)